MKNKTIEILKDKADYLLNYECKQIKKETLHLPGADFIKRVYEGSDRSPAVLRNLSNLFNHGRLSGSGYLSLLPIDQGVEYSAGMVFSSNHLYFDPENIVKLGLEAGCSGVVSSLGVLGAVARKYCYKIPLILKLNHNELLSYPNVYQQNFFSDIDQAFKLGAMGVAATIYFGSSESKKQIYEISQAFKYAHEMGMFTVLWTYLRQPYFIKGESDYHSSTDLTGQANYLGATIEADLIKQKMPDINFGYKELEFGSYNKGMYETLTTEHPIDMTRYQVLNCYSGRVGLITSGGAAGESDIQEAVIKAVVNKRAGGTGLMLGRKAFQKPFKEGVELLNFVQDVYLCKDITIA